MNRILTTALALGLAAPLAAHQKPIPPVEVNSRLPKETQVAQIVFKAEEFEAGKKLPEAAAAFQQAAALAETDWLLWERAGWAHLDNGQADAALKAFEAGRRAAPPGSPVPGGLLIAYFGLGNKDALLPLVKQLAAPEIVDRAVEVVTKGMAAKPRSADWSFALGYLHARILGNSSRGIGPLEAVVAADPKNAEAWLMLSELNAFINRGDKEDAAAIQYLDLAPETADAYRLRAARYAQLQKYGDAAAEYREGIAKNPEAPELYYGLARVHERTGDPKTAEATYRKLIDVATTARKDALALAARAQLANFLVRQKNYAGAEPFYREAAARPEASVATLTTWGSLLALTAKWDEAAKALETAAARDEKLRGTTHPAVREELLTERYRAAVCRVAAGQKDLARPVLESALAVTAETRTTPEMEAAAFLAWIQGKTAGAERLAYKPGDERWASFTWRREAEEGEMEVRGRYSTAATAWRAILQQAQKRFPDCWAADYSLARLYASAGYTDDALKLLGQVNAGRPDWWAPFLARGEYWAKKRDKTEGIPPLRKAVQLAPECRQAKVLLSLLTGIKEDAGNP